RAALADLADEIFECTDGEHALASYAAHRPACVLMDIEMPGHDGLTATRCIKDAFPDARIVIVSAFDTESLRAAATDAGASGYVRKDNLPDLRRALLGR